MTGYGGEDISLWTVIMTALSAALQVMQLELLLAPTDQ